jgi:hypothetical protein
MENWLLEGDEPGRIRDLIRRELMEWGVDPDGELVITLGADGDMVDGELLHEASLLAPGPDLLKQSTDIEAFVGRVDALLHGDQARPGRDLLDLLPDIEHLVRNLWELQNRVVELERGQK